MKTKFLLIGLLLISFSFVSCTKNWVCDCSGGDDNPSLSSSSEYFNITKKDAKERCSTHQDYLKKKGLAIEDCSLRNE